jgi:hypothetical protein
MTITAYDPAQLGDTGGSERGHQQGSRNGGEEQATARESRTWAPRKLICTVCGFWMMKITSIASTRTPAIKPLRMLLILVGARVTQRS